MKNAVVCVAVVMVLGGCSGPVSRTISGTLTIPHPAQTRAVFTGTGGHVAFPVDAAGNFTAVLRTPGSYTLRFVGNSGAPGVLGTLTNGGGIQRIKVGVKNSSLAMGNIAYQDGSTGTAPPASNADHSCSGNGDDLRAEHPDEAESEADGDDDGPEWDGLDDGEGIEAPEADDDDDGDDVCEAEDDEDEDEGEDD